MSSFPPLFFFVIRNFYLHCVDDHGKHALIVSMTYVPLHMCSAEETELFWALALLSLSLVAMGLDL